MAGFSSLPRASPTNMMSGLHPVQDQAGQGDVMAGYRIYFLNESGGIEAADTIEVDSDSVAVTMADDLQEALSEAYAGYEVWQEVRQVAARRDRKAPRPPQCLAEVTERMQQSLLDREEYLRNSRLTLRESRKLLQRIEALRIQTSGRKIAG
jgi:hypothetical protein